MSRRDPGPGPAAHGAGVRDADIDPDRVRESTEINRHDLIHEFASVAGHMAYWSERFAEAQRGYGEAKFALELTEARLAMRHRETLGALVSAGELKLPRGVTEAMVQERVLTDPVYQGARLDLIEAEAAKARLHGIVGAVATKRDMLVSLGAHVRAEMNLDPLIRERATRE